MESRTREGTGMKACPGEKDDRENDFPLQIPCFVTDETRRCVTLEDLNETLSVGDRSCGLLPRLSDRITWTTLKSGSRTRTKCQLIVGFSLAASSYSRCKILRDRQEETRYDKRDDVYGQTFIELYGSLKIPRFFLSINDSSVRWLSIRTISMRWYET